MRRFGTADERPFDPHRRLEVPAKGDHSSEPILCRYVAILCRGYKESRFTSHPLEQRRDGTPRNVQAGFSIARTGSSLTGRRVADHMTIAMPARTDPALASCAFERPQITLGLRRMNSTRKREVPLSRRYS